MNKRWIFCSKDFSYSGHFKAEEIVRKNDIREDFLGWTKPVAKKQLVGMKRMG